MIVYRIYLYDKPTFFEVWIALIYYKNKLIGFLTFEEIFDFEGFIEVVGYIKFHVLNYKKGDHTKESLDDKYNRELNEESNKESHTTDFMSRGHDK